MGTKIVNPPLIAIIGPTASGKSAVSLRLAKEINGAIISADSQQIYKYANIGTNQPSGQWKKSNSKLKSLGIHKVYLVNKTPHFFINTLSPTKQYSAAEFQKQANKLIKKLSTAGFVPIIVGGTGLYVSAIIEGYNFPKSRVNSHTRKRLERLSTTALQNKLRSLDADGWKTIDRKNRRRLIRAIEHYLTTGQSLFLQQQKKSRPNTLIIGLKLPKKILRQSIEKRTKAMLKQGLVDEVSNLVKKYPQSTLLQSIGYREVVKMLQGEANQPEAEQQISNHTWQYARRQMTWFRRIPKVKWLKSAKHISKLAKKFLQDFS